MGQKLSVQGFFQSSLLPTQITDWGCQMSRVFNLYIWCVMLLVYLSTALLMSLIFSLCSSPFTSVCVVVRTVSLKPSLGLISKWTDISHMESSVKQFSFQKSAPFEYISTFGVGTGCLPPNLPANSWIKAVTLDLGSLVGFRREPNLIFDLWNVYNPQHGALSASVL